MAELYVGIVSGTSLDGLDTALVELGADTCNVVRARTTPFPEPLGDGLAALVADPRTDLRDLGALNVAFAEFVAECVLALLVDSGHEPDEITAIGFSGHTIFHQPLPPGAFTLQLGDPSTIAARTHITTVADLRSMDVAFGGQGAPVLPALHAWQLGDAEEIRVAVNIGGIANLTCLNPSRAVTGFDSGPGNALMDAWIRLAGRGPFDHDGTWAKSGTVVSDLLRRLRSDDYFSLPAPKSTGLEHFNLAWVQRALADIPEPAPADVQATLLELTATTIADAIKASEPEAQRVIVCGGGAYNAALVRRLEALVAPAVVETSAAHGIEPAWVEAAGFAWLARARLKCAAGNMPSVTGAREPAVLGGVYSGETPNA